MPVTYEQLAKVRHPDFAEKVWKVLRVLYAGGQPSRWPKDVLEEVFPKRAGEEADVYDERKKRSFFVPYPGQLVDFIVASLSSDPVTLSVRSEGATPKDASGAAVASSDEVLPAYWEQWCKNVARKGAPRTSLNQLLRAQVLTALVCKRAWTLVDLPRLKEGDAPPTDLADEEKRGLRDAYAVPVDPECVLDWECDLETGELEWALVGHVSNRRESLESTRGRTREEYTLYTREDWTLFVVEYDTETKRDQPKEKDVIAPAASGRHSFGKVPLVPFDLPDGLFAMGKIESLAREHFNASCALAWGVYRSLFQFLLVKLAPPDAINPITDNPNRGVDQPVGPGRAFVLGADDDASMIGADAAPFAAAQGRLDNLRDEMHRVLHNMALSTDNSAGALKRSADSKKQDSAATAVVLRALGLLMREHAVALAEMAQRGRKDKPLEWIARGADDFDEVSLDAFVEEAALLENVDIPSSTFQRKYKSMLARRILGSTATVEDLELIEQELEDAITPETLAMMSGRVNLDDEGAPLPGVPGAGGPPKKPPASKKTSAKKPPVSSKRGK